MPIEVQQIRERRKRVTVELGADASVGMDYYPARAALFDRDEVQRLAEATAGKPKREQRRVLAERLLEFVAEWDVTSGGEPFPLDADAIADTFDEAFIAICIGAVISDTAQGKVNGELLSMLGTVTSSPTDGAESSPATKGNRASRRSAKSRKSPSSAASPRGSSPRTRSGSPS